MAKKIIGGIGSLLGVKKKKKAEEPAPAAAPKGPIVTQLGGAESARAMLRRRLAQVGAPSDKLGG